MQPNPPLQVILDLSRELTLYINTMAQLGEAFTEDYTIGRVVSDLFSYMHDKKAAASYIQAYVSDCLEVFANDHEPSIAQTTEEPGFFSRELNSAESRAWIYGNAIQTLGNAMFDQLQALGMYNSDDILCYAFQDFVGRDLMLEYISPQP